MIDDAVNYILDISSDTYEGMLYQMPEKQRNVFLAIGRDREVKGISGNTYRIYDQFFQLWLEREALTR